MSFLHSDMSLTSDDPSDLFSPCFNRTENYLAGDSSPGTTSNDANLQGRQLNPVMKRPRIMDARKNSGALQHQRSAKALISRYESMSSSRSIRPPPRLLGPPKKTRSSSPINKDKSPIRQSFRNLFGVFRKGNALAKDKTSRSTGIPPIIGSRKSNLLPSQLASPNPVVLPQAGIGKVDDSQPSAKPYSGTLLYLSRVSSSSLILPVWTVCTASLQKDHILVKWITAHGNPSYHSISLADCGDVRSLALSQISPDERALLPSKGDPEDLRVFEILFEGRPREKFAATSAHERAGWVSAIWDAILPSQERKEIDCSEVVAAEDTKPLISTFSTHCETECAAEMASIKNTLPPLSCRPERSLPPTPTDAMPPPLPPQAKWASLHDFPRSPGTIYPTLSVSCTSSTGPRSKYPSIANLGQLSVVKQRLAQIERINSSSSTAVPPSPCSDRGAKYTSPKSKVEHSETSRSDLQRRRSLSSNDGDSIFDSYCGTMSPYEGHPVPSSTEKSSQLNVKKRLYPVVRHESDIQKASWDLQSSPGSFSPLSQYSVADEPADGPSVDTIKPCDQAANFGDQILSLRHDVRRLPGQLKALIVDTKQPPLLEAIEQSVRGIDQQTKARDNELQDVREILHGIRETIKGQITLGDHGGFGQVTTNGSGLLLSLEDIRIKLGSGLPEVLRKLGEIQVAQALASQTDGTESPSIVMNNVKPSSENSAECKRSGDEIAVALSEVHMKLDGLLALYQGPLAHPRSGGENLPNNPTGVNQIPEELQEILSLLKSDENHRNTQEQRQAESARYLNELNSWLEIFVSNGTSQIQEIATGVQQLCSALGCTPKSRDAPGAYSGGDGPDNLLAGIHQLLLASENRDENAKRLQASVNSLVTIIDHQNTNIFTPESVLELINRQRHDQEGLLRTLASELSNEIRGERLKFVEAMQSATSINVQLHVDQFKTELTREVLAMTQEVERLQRERQAVENQIADLLAFYSKQKQTGVPWTVSPSAQNEALRPSSPRRPLPHPSNSTMPRRRY